MRILFVGINPGIRSSLTGHHFAGFSNRFWKLLYESRLVPEGISYQDDVRLPEWGFGITNIVPRPTPGIDTLRPDEYVEGRLRLRRKVYRYRPAVLAAVGVTVFRALFPERKGAVSLGLQPEQVGPSAVFVLPNPSGRNANFTYQEMLAAFRELRALKPWSSLPLGAGEGDNPPRMKALLTLGSLLLAAAAANAHHSFAAQYDVNKPLTVSGSIVRVEWTNPHIHFFLDVKDASGKVTQWRFEGYPPNMLVRQGWRRDVTLKPGDMVTVFAWQARDEPTLAMAREVTFPDGRKMTSGPPAGTGGQ